MPTSCGPELLRRGSGAAGLTGMNERSSRLNDDGDAVVARLSGAPAGLGNGEIPCKRFLLFCCLSVLGQVQGLTAASSM